MIVLIVLVSFWVIHYINHIEEEKCFNRLYEEAGDLADRIETYVRSDREELELLANVIAGYEDLESEKLRNLLSFYTAVGMMSRMELLLPDDTVLVSDGTKVDASGRISFAAEAAKGAHITDRGNGSYEYGSIYCAPLCSRDSRGGNGGHAVWGG